MQASLAAGAHSAENRGGAEARGLTAEQVNNLRRAYFSQIDAASAAASLGVEVERIAQHVAQARRRRRSASFDVSRLHLADLALATACVDDRPGAWTRLIAEYEPRLIRASEPQEGWTQAVITVRRMFIDMRRESGGQSRSALDLRRYDGHLSLESWLYERLNGRVAVVAAIRRADVSRKREEVAHRLHLALEMLRSERMNVQKIAEAMELGRIVNGGASAPPRGHVDDGLA